jgi:spore germination protein
MKDTNKRIMYTLLVTAIIVYSSSFAILMTLERMDYRNYLQGEYSKNIYDLISSVQNIESDLGKSAVSSSKESRQLLFQEIYRNTTIANDKLHSLPVPQNVIDGTSKLLSQVGDFCYSLVKSSSGELTDTENKNINRLKKQSDQLLINLNNAADEINQGRVKWGEIRQKTMSVFAKEKESSVESKFTEIQKQVTSYPALVYDGPFSENKLDIKPKVLSLKQVSESDAKSVVKKSVKEDSIESIKLISQDGSAIKASIPTYRFSVKIKGRKDGEDVIIEISKNGGKILYLLDQRNIGQPKINKEKALKNAKDFLNKLAYKNMEESYISQYENTMVVNYIYKQGNIVMYTDALKLKIAMDDGSIVGVESDKYLTSHIDNRKGLAAKIGSKAALSKVSKNLKIQSQRLAVIPTETNKEVLCYEFYGKYENEEYIVYINALTGAEQKIIQIINTPNGKLAM